MKTIINLFYNLFLKRWDLVLGLFIFLILCVGSVYSLFFMNYNPVDEVNMAISFSSPSSNHWLGTDELGRDMLRRIIKGIDAFFLPGLVACLVALVLGILLGGLISYQGGYIESAGFFLISLINCFPRFVLILLICSIFDSHIFLMAVIIGLTFVPPLSISIRHLVQKLKEEEFIEASRAHGLGHARILFYHILWLHCKQVIIRHLSYIFSYMILVETCLSFLGGFGMEEPWPSWGNMLAMGKDYIFRGIIWPSLIPTFAIIITVCAFNLLGDALGKQKNW